MQAPVLEPVVEQHDVAAERTATSQPRARSGVTTTGRAPRSASSNRLVGNVFRRCARVIDADEAGSRRERASFERSSAVRVENDDRLRASHGAVAARDDRRPPSRRLEFLTEPEHERRLATPTDPQIADADHRDRRQRDSGAGRDRRAHRAHEQRRRKRTRAAQARCARAWRQRHRAPRGFRSARSYDAALPSSRALIAAARPLRACAPARHDSPRTPRERRRLPAFAADGVIEPSSTIRLRALRHRERRRARSARSRSSAWCSHVRETRPGRSRHTNAAGSARLCPPTATRLPPTKAAVAILRSRAALRSCRRPARPKPQSSRARPDDQRQLRQRALGESDEPRRVARGDGARVRGASRDAMPVAERTPRAPSLPRPRASRSRADSAAHPARARAPAASSQSTRRRARRSSRSPQTVVSSGRAPSATSRSADSGSRAQTRASVASAGRKRPCARR